MFEIIKLVAIVGAIAALYFAFQAAWDGFRDHIGQPYAEAQRELDQPIIDKERKDRTAAESERDNAQADTKACVASTAKQSAGIVAAPEKKAPAKKAAAKKAPAKKATSKK